MSAKKLILVVEDDSAIRESITDVLEMEDFAVTVAENGAAGLEILRAGGELPDLILLDIMMPVMDGYQFREQQLQDPRLAAIPTVVLSADRNFHTNVQGKGFAHALKKPIDLDQLLRLLGDLVHKR
jgi:CheY-like chemotaxis protein